jgi:glycosyltransferase involved in cell wall biosynthesis
VTYRVVYLDHVARLSGAEIALARVLPSLGDRVDPHVILGEEGPLVDRLHEAGVSVEVMPLAAAARDMRRDAVHPMKVGATSLAASAQYVERVRRRLREIQPDLIHTNSLKAALYGGVAGRLAGVPVIWHIRDRIAPDYMPMAAVRLVRTAARILPSAVVANSRSTLATLPGRIGRVSVSNTVVYDSVGEAPPSPPIHSRPFRVGTIGRLASWKGQDLFLDSFARAFPDGECEAWVVGSAMFGEDDYARSLRAQAGRLGVEDRVQFRGFRDDVWKELSQIDTLVHCSLTPEPFGQVVVEGMAAGVPVIAANAGGPSEIVTHNVDGLLISPGDVRSLATAMRSLHDDPGLRSTLASRGRVTAAKYSPDRTARELIAVYEKVLDHQR